MPRTKRFSLVFFPLLFFPFFFRLIEDHIASLLILHIEIHVRLLKVIVRLVTYKRNLEQLAQLRQYPFYLIISLYGTCPLRYLLQDSKQSLIHFMILRHPFLKTNRIVILHHHQKLPQMLIMYLVSIDLSQTSIEDHILHDFQVIFAVLMILHLEAKFKKLVVEASQYVGHHRVSIFYQFHHTIVRDKVVSERLGDQLSDRKELFCQVGPEGGYLLVIDQLMHQGKARNL